MRRRALLLLLLALALIALAPAEIDTEVPDCAPEQWARGCGDE